MMMCQTVQMVTWSDFSQFCDENGIGVVDIMEMCRMPLRAILSWRAEGLVPSEAFEVLNRQVFN